MSDALVIERHQWERFLNEFTQEHEGDLMTVEVLDPEYGDQVEGEAVPFAFASFDSRNDTVIISAAGTSEPEEVQLRHLVDHPTTMDIALPEPDRAILRVVGPTTTTLASFYPP